MAEAAVVAEKVRVSAPSADSGSVSTGEEIYSLLDSYLVSLI